MAAKGKLVSVNVSREKGVKKKPAGSVLITEEGLSGDAHAGKWHRQVSLLALESIEKMREFCEEKGVKPGYGDFAENLTTEGLDLLSLPVGRRMKIGESVVLEVTQHGKECHRGCEIREAVGDCVMPREGIFAKVIRGGMIGEGDEIAVDL